MLMELPDQIAWQIALLAAQPTLPEGYNIVPKKFRIGDGAALTAINGKLRKITVMYDPFDSDLPDLTKPDDRIGVLTATFVHELSLHANTLGLDPEVEHNRMFDPEYRHIYLDACLWAIRLLSGRTQQQAFIGEWEKDINKRLDEYVEHMFPLVAERKKWILREARSMTKLIKKK